MSTMERSGYVAEVDYSSEDRVFHGKVLLLRDLVTFEGETVEELEESFDESLTAYLDTCQESGIEPEKPYSGKFQVRMSPEQHREVAIEAAKSGESLNTYAVKRMTAGRELEFVKKKSNAIKGTNTGTAKRSRKARKKKSA